MLHLTLASAYIRKLLENVKVADFLRGTQAEIFAEFAKIAATEANMNVSSGFVPADSLAETSNLRMR